MCLRAQKTENLKPQYGNKFNKEFKSGPHQRTLKKRIKEARQKKSTIWFLWYKILENENYL